MFDALARWWRLITGSATPDAAKSLGVAHAQASAHEQQPHELSSAMGGSYQGRHDGASDKRIYGWAWDSARPTTPISVSIYDGTELLATVIADQFRQDLLDSGKGNGCHGFEYPTPATLRDGKLHVIRVVFTDTETELPKTPRTLTATVADTYSGFHDETDAKRIRGWAWDSTRPDTPIDVTIYDGDTLLATVTADQLRPSLLESGKGNGCHGFSIDTPDQLKDGQPHTIRVTFADTQLPLKNTPQTLIYPPK